MAPVSSKRKRVSKNKKRNWRKHVDINDVEEHLEEHRLQERTGGLVAEKLDEDLFFVEKKIKTEEPVPKKRKREPKPLRCHASLLPDPKVKPVTIKQNVRKEDNLKKKCDRVITKLQSKRQTRTERLATKQKEESVKKRLEKRKEKQVLPQAGFDLWGEADINANPINIDEHYLKVTRRTRRKPPPKFFEKSSGIVAVEVAHPGASYNPTFEDHQNLLETALTVELRKEKEEKRLQRALDEKFPSQAPTHESWLKEMSAGVVDDETEEPITSLDVDPEDLDKTSNNPPVNRDDRKTEKQKKKQKERKLLEKKAETEKEIRIRKNQVFRLKSIKTKVKERVKELEDRAQRKAQLKEKFKDKPKKLGKLKYEDIDIPIKLSDELEGTLRLLKPEGHLLADRFNSFQKRNIIETRNRAKFKRKYKPKEFEKKGHKAVVL